MKRIKLTLAAMLACLALTAATCNPSQQRVAFNTVYSAEQSVNTAYSAYLDLVIAGKVATNDVPKVSIAYNLFQKAAADAAAYIAAHPNSTAPVELTTAANNALSAIATAKGGAK